MRKGEILDEGADLEWCENEVGALKDGPSKSGPSDGKPEPVYNGLVLLPTIFLGSFPWAISEEVSGRAKKYLRVLYPSQYSTLAPVVSSTS